MAKIIYIPEKWIVVWHEKIEEKLITHKEFFTSEQDAVAFAKKLDTPKEREKRGLPLVKEKSEK